MGNCDRRGLAWTMVWVHIGRRHVRFSLLDDDDGDDGDADCQANGPDAHQSSMMAARKRTTMSPST